MDNCLRQVLWLFLPYIQRTDGYIYKARYMQ